MILQGDESKRQINNKLLETSLDEYLHKVMEESEKDKTNTVEAVSYERSLKEDLQNHDEKLLKTSLDEFNFSVRVSSALARCELKTIRDVLNFGWNNIFKLRNVGRKSLEELKNTIENYIETSLTTEKDGGKVSFTEVLTNLLLSLTDKQVIVIKSRYGYEDGKKKTLDQIGQTLRITRERVRQIIVRSHKQLSHSLIKKYFQEILVHIESSLLHNKGVVSVDDLYSDSFFYSSSKNQLRFLINLIADLYEERYRIIEKRFFTSLNDEELKELNITIDKASFKCNFPTGKDDFYKEIITAIGTISKDYLSYFLIYKKHVVISDEKVLSPGKLSLSQRLKLVMRDIDVPLYYTEIAGRYKRHFGDLQTKNSSLDRLIHARLDYSEDFIIVGPGTFILRDKFRVPDNINEVVETSKEILRGLNGISDTKYLIEKLKQKGVNVGIVNAYSLKPIMLEHPGFVRYSKFEIGLEEFAEKCERKSLSDLMYDVLIRIGKPLHSRDIWKQISKQRGFPRYAIEQRLYKEPQFIKVAPTTYTVKENILSYETKHEIIVNFTKEWINLKGHAVSAFFVNEVLRETEEIKDLHIGLVEHVLATSSKFQKVSNGFYTLAKRNWE